MVTACAACHALTKADYTPEWPADRSTGELPENKHYKAIESADKGYKLIPEDKRKALLEVVKWVDENSSLTLKAPTSAKPGQPIEVTVETKGGIGPVVGIFLVDLPLRFQARPIASDGWYVVGKPTVIGADGKEQTWWLDKRANEKKNCNRSPGWSSYAAGCKSFSRAAEVGSREGAGWLRSAASHASST